MTFTNTETYSLWRQAITHVLDNATTYTDADDRKCYEVRDLTMRIQDAPEASITEPYDALRGSGDWVYPTKQQLLDVIFDKEQINSLDYTYGSRLLNFDNAINQVRDYVIPLLEDNPRTRRAVAQIYDPRLDSNTEQASTPGIIYFAFQLRDNTLHCSAMIRSNDIFFGYPANIYQIFHIHRWVADQLDADQGDLTTVSNSAHVFHDALPDIKAILDVDVDNQ